MDLKEIPYAKLSKKEKTVEKGKDVNKEKHFIIKESKIDREKEIIKSVINSIYEISSKMKDIELVIIKINNNSKKIRIISDIINDISKQTHILELNETLEKLKDWKQENEFNTITNEIKRLASLPDVSVKDIENIIEIIRETRNKDTNTIKEEKIKVDEKVEFLTNTGKAFEKSINNIKDLEKKVNNLESELKIELSEYLAIILNNITNITKQVTFSLKKGEFSQLVMNTLDKVNLIKNQVIN